MIALVSLVVCLSGQPGVCETVVPGYARQDDGVGPSLFECLGVAGQDIARKWLAENPGHVLRRVQCSVSNHPERLRDRLESPRA